MNPKNIFSGVITAVLVAGAFLPVAALAVEPSPLNPGGLRPSQPVRPLQSVRTEVRDRLSAARKNHVKNWWSRVSNRLKNLTTRESKLADKIQVRLGRLASSGKDVSAQKALLATAKTSIATAQQALTDATAQVETILANNKPADAFKQLQDLQKTVLGKIRDAHLALVQVVAATRPLVSPRPSPTVTATVGQQ